MGTITVETVRVNNTASAALFVVGFGLIPTVLEAAVVIVLLWLFVRIRELADADSARLKAKLSKPSLRRLMSSSPPTLLFV